MVYVLLHLSSALVAAAVFQLAAERWGMVGIVATAICIAVFLEMTTVDQVVNTPLSEVPRSAPQLAGVIGPLLGATATWLLLRAQFGHWSKIVLISTVMLVSYYASYVAGAYAIGR